MKKISLLFICSILFISCTSSDKSTTPVDENSVLVTKIVESHTGSPTVTSNFSYSGSKLVQITNNDGTYVTFTYAGNLITMISYYTSTSTLQQKEQYVYNSNDELITFFLLDYTENRGSKEVFVHNNAGTILVTKYTGTTTSQTTLSDTGSISLTNGIVTSISMNLGGTHNYTYDTKNSPFKNITGLDKIGFVDLEASGFVHNILKDEKDGFPSSTITNVYTYNTLNFPLTRTWTEGTSTSVNVQEFTY